MMVYYLLTDFLSFRSLINNADAPTAKHNNEAPTIILSSLIDRAPKAIGAPGVPKKPAKETFDKSIFLSSLSPSINLINLNITLLSNDVLPRLSRGRPSFLAPPNSGARK